METGRSEETTGVRARGVTISVDWCVVFASRPQDGWWTEMCEVTGS